VTRQDPEQDKRRSMDSKCVHIGQKTEGVHSTKVPERKRKREKKGRGRDA
jgi:hypothetical protein